MTRIVVTGGSGKAGRAVVRDLLEQGHDVLNVDRVLSAESSGPDSPAPFLPADLTDFGQTLEALSRGKRLSGVDAVVHDYAPIDERHELRPESSYDLSKVLGGGDGPPVQPLERHPLRRPALLQHHGTGRLRALPVLLGRPAPAQAEPVELRGRQPRRPERPAGPGGRRARRGGADHRGRGHRHADPSRQLMAQVFPGVPVKADLAELGTLLGIDKARRLLGHAPDFTWRELEL